MATNSPRRRALSVNCGHKLDMNSKTGGGCRNAAQLDGELAGFCSAEHKQQCRKFVGDDGMNSYQEDFRRNVDMCRAFEADRNNGAHKEYDGFKNGLTETRKDFLTAQWEAKEKAYNAELNQQVAELKAHYMPWYMRKYTAENDPSLTRCSLPPFGMTVEAAKEEDLIDPRSATCLDLYQDEVGACVDAPA